MNVYTKDKIEDMIYKYLYIGSVITGCIIIYKVGGNKIIKNGINMFLDDINEIERQRKLDEEFVREQKERMVWCFNEPSDREIEGYDPDLDDAFEDPCIRYP